MLNRISFYAYACMEVNKQLKYDVEFLSSETNLDIYKHRHIDLLF